jgi:antitoxin (DNA-binding transcriptional repressor) of toxin-antitoxin stability system
MRISLSELKTGTEKYIALAGKQDIYITMDGNPVAKLTSANTDKVSAAMSLFGILPADADLDAARTARLSGE